MFIRRSLLFICWVGIAIGSPLALGFARDPVLGRITSVPPTAQAGGAIRVISTIKNASPRTAACGGIDLAYSALGRTG